MSETKPQNAVAPTETLKTLFDKSKKEIEAALPKHLTTERMVRICMTEVRKNPKLLECSPVSLIGAVIQAAQLGLEPGSALGHCYLIPFFNGQKKQMEVQFMPGYRGFIDLARRSGQVSSISARVVRLGDDFTYRYGMNETLHHIPGGDNEDAKITHVYAIANFKDGSWAFEVMTHNQIEKIRQKSKAGNSGPWVEHWEEMARKTVIRRLFKYLPVSIELQQAVRASEDADAGVSQNNESVIELEKDQFNTVEEQKTESASKHTHRIKAVRSKDESQQVAETEAGSFEAFTSSVN